MKELAKLFGVDQDTNINWERRNVKPVEKNLVMVKKFLELEQVKE